MWAVSQDRMLATYINKLQVIQKNGRWGVGTSSKTILAMYDIKLQAIAAIEMAMCRIGKDHVFYMPNIERVDKFIEDSIEFNNKFLKQRR